MRRLLLIIVMFIGFILLTLSGCISPKDNSNLDVIEFEEAPIFHSLDNAIGALESDDGMRMARSPNYTIHTIIGENITKEGEAKTWILAVKAEKSFYFVYTGDNYIIMEWNEENPDNAINLNNILSPSELLSKYSQTIYPLCSGSFSGIRELELNNGKYYIRGFSDGKEWQYTFDAVTGRDLLIEYPSFFPLPKTTSNGLKKGALRYFEWVSK